MTRSRRLFGVLACVGFVGVAVLLWYRLMSASSGIGKVASMPELHRGADQRPIAVLSHPMEANRTPAPAQQVPELPSAVSSGKKETPSAEWLVKADDPEFMRRTYVQMAGTMQRRYGPLFKELGLTSDQIDAFIKLLIDERQVGVDLTAASLRRGEDPTGNPTAFEAQVRAGKAQVEDQIKSLLGDQNYADYRDYNRGATVSNTVSRFQEILGGSSAPLSSDQNARFKQLLVASNVGHVNEQVIADAQNFLTVAQLEGLQQLWIEQQKAAQKREKRGVPP